MIHRLSDIILIAIWGYLITITMIVIAKVKLSRTGILVYLIGGGLTAITRIACFWFVNYRMHQHTMTPLVDMLNMILEPDVLLATKILNSQLDNELFYYTVFSLALILGSYLWALPLLLIKHRKNLNKWN